MLSFRSRVVIIVLGMVIGISSLLFTNDMARQLREKEQNEVAIWAAAFRELGADPGNPLLLSIITTRNNIPFILTDGGVAGGVFASDSRLHPESSEPVARQARPDDEGQSAPEGADAVQRDAVYLFRRIPAAQDAGLFPVHPVAGDHRVCRVRIHHVPFDEAGRAEPRLDRGWRRRRPTSWVRRPLRCSGGSNT